MNEYLSNVFNRLWINHFSCIPPLDKMPVELRERLKEFAKKVFETTISVQVSSDDLETMLDDAHDVGFRAGVKEKMEK
jgi:hypothetical protein